MTPTVYFDLDGVIAQFTHGTAYMYNKPIEECIHGGWNFHHKWGMTDAELYAPMGREFWAGLGVWEDGMALLRSVESLIGEDNIVLLTTPCETEGCSEGKRDWVKRRLPRHLSNLMIGGAKHKLAGPSKILIDDSDTNIEKFHKAGGNTFTVPRPWNALHMLTDKAGMFDASFIGSLFREALKK